MFKSFSRKTADCLSTADGSSFLPRKTGSPRASSDEGRGRETGTRWRTAISVLITVLAAQILSGCTYAAAASPASISQTSELKAGKEIKLISWNVETFFDASTDGTEYSEFTGSKTAWNADKYADRLKRLADYIKDQDADIYCFMEIENEAVVLDISNQLQGSDSRGTRWNYAAFGKDPDGAIGCAVFSKLSLESMTLHQTDYHVALPTSAFETETPGTRLKPPAMRPLLELHLKVSQGQRISAEKSNSPEKQRSVGLQDCPPDELVLFVCHWKSKSGGEAESAVWRSCQEALLARRMKKALDEGSAVLACGDFNRGLSEFLWSYQEDCVELRGFSENVTATSPWFGSTQPGTYYYHGEWNQLDHIFAAGGTSVLSFSTGTDGDLVKKDGTPNGYSVKSGKGWSDHLPIICTFTVSAQ